MATINDLNFRTSPLSLGIPQQPTVGEGLAKLVTAGLGGYTKYKQLEKEYDEEDERKLSEAEQLAYNNIMSEVGKRRQESGYSLGQMTKDKELEFLSEEARFIKDGTSGFKSKWFKLDKKVAIDTNLYSEYDKKYNEYTTELADTMFSENATTMLMDKNNKPEDWKQLMDNYKGLLPNTSDGTLVNKVASIAVNSIKSMPDSEYSRDVGKNILSGLSGVIKDKKILDVVKSEIEAKNNGLVKINTDIEKNKLFDFITSNPSVKEINKYIKRLNGLDVSPEFKFSAKSKLDSEIKGKTSGIDDYIDNYIKVAKNTYGDGSEERNQMLMVPTTSSKYRELYELSTTKAHISSHIETMNYEELNSMLSKNGTVDAKDSSGKIFKIPYNKDFVKNQVALKYRMDLDKALSLRTDVNHTEQEKNIIRAERSRLLTNLFDAEAKIDGIDYGISKRVNGFITDSTQKFTDFNTLETFIQIGKDHQQTLTNNGVLYNRSFKAIANEFELLANKYTETNKDGSKFISDENKKKILTKLNTTKEAEVRLYNTSMNINLKELKEVTSNITLAFDEREDGVFNALAYASKMEELSAKEVSRLDEDQILEKLDKYSYKVSNPDYIYNYFADKNDDIRIPKDVNFRTAFNKIVGKRLTTKDGRTFKIPSFGDISVQFTGPSSGIIIDRESKSKIFELDVQTAKDIINNQITIK